MNRLVTFSVVAPFFATMSYFGYQRFFGEPLEYELPFGRESVEILRGYGPAMDVIGEPIKVHELVKDEKFFKLEENHAQVKMIIEGKKRFADLYVNASKQNEKSDWRIDTMEIKYRGSPLKPIKFYGTK
jgi:hypothetical protein